MTMTEPVRTPTASAATSAAAPTHSGISTARILLLYNVYRFLLGSALLSLGLLAASGTLPLRTDNPLLLWWVGAWLVSALWLSRRIKWLTDAGDLRLLALMLFDVVMLGFLVRLGDGLGPGLPLLHLLTVAIAAVLISHRLTATAVAALATLAVLSDTAYQVHRGLIETGDLLQAGLLGVLLFAISLLLQLMVSRMATIERLADAATTQVASLEELNEQVIAQMSTGVCRISGADRLETLNQAAANLLELPHVGATATIRDISPSLAEHLTRWQAGEHVTPTPFKRTAHGRLLMPKPVRIGHDFDTETLLFIEDFTPVTEAAQTLKLNALGKLTASIAHEIRNPLTAISHATQLLEDTEDNPSEHKALRDIILNNTQRVNEIIENVLQLSRREGPQQEPLDLLAWLKLFIPEYEQGQHHGQCVTLEAPETVGTVKFDPGNLRRILTNLLDNGVRHAGEHTGQFAVTLSLSKDVATNRAHMDVIDKGAGVPDDIQSRLFEPFVTTSPRGSGLGLYLCRELCQSNGATLTYERSNQTTRFRIAVPIWNHAS